ncbi:MAG: hypothetical protein ACOCUI_01030 [bacterium]
MKDNKRLIVIIGVLLVSLLLLPGIVFAQTDRSFIALGISIGEPTNLIGRWHLNPNQAIEVNGGFTLVSPFFNNINDTFYDSNKIKFNLSGKYIYNLFLTRSWDLPLYLGVGINLKFESLNVTRFGIILPTIGLEKMFRTGAVEWGIYIESSAVTNLTPEGQSVIDWLGVVFDMDPETNWPNYFYDAFDIHFNIGLRFYIQT